MSRNRSRRSFLGTVAASSFLLPSPSKGGPRTPNEVAPEEDYWGLVRQQFPFPEEKIPLNAANLTPSPRVVLERVTDLTKDIDADCSFNNRAKFSRLREETRIKVASHLGVSPDQIALVRNTSEANNTINNGLSLQRGDEVLLWDQNHPTNNVAWTVRATRFGFGVKRINTSGCHRSTQKLIDIFSAAITDRTKALAITHLSNTTGVRLPVKQLCQVAHEQGVFVHVDGAQTWGALNVNLSELGCDSYAASAHKWLVGPKEVGILFIAKDRVGEIWPNVVAPGWGDDEIPDVVGARKFESLGQRDDAALAAVGTAIDFHTVIGPERVEKRVLELARILREGIIDLGLELVTPEEAELSGGVCVIKAPSEKRKEVVDRLYLDHGVAVAPTGGVRICPHIYNTVSHIDRVLKGLSNVRRLIV